MGKRRGDRLWRTRIEALEHGDWFLPVAETGAGGAQISRCPSGKSAQRYAAMAAEYQVLPLPDSAA
jgi:hypothetical protein